MITGMDFFKKVVLPVGLVGTLLMFFWPLYILDGELNYFYLWLLVGIPFGTRRMCLWIVPINHDMTAAAGIIALNLIIGGLIGGVVAVVQLHQAVWYCLKCMVYGMKKVAGRG